MLITRILIFILAQAIQYEKVLFTPKLDFNTK